MLKYFQVTLFFSFLIALYIQPMIELISTVLLKIDWNLASEIKIGPVTLRFYSLMWLLSFVIGLLLALRVWRREDQDMKKFDWLFLAVILGIFLGARLGHVFFYDWPYYKDHLAEILLPFEFGEDGTRFTGFSGLASHGALVGALISLAVFSKKMKEPYMWVLDRIALVSTIGAGLIRLGNFFNHEIVGKVINNPDNLPWATKFKFNGNDDALGIYRHPAQLYEALWYFFTFVVLWSIYRKKGKNTPHGLLAGLFIIMVFGFRFVVEFWKETQNTNDDGVLASWGLNIGQLLSILPVILGLYFLFGFARKQGIISMNRKNERDAKELNVSVNRGQKVK